MVRKRLVYASKISVVAENNNAGVSIDSVIWILFIGIKSKQSDVTNLTIFLPLSSNLFKKAKNAADSITFVISKF